MIRIKDGSLLDADGMAMLKAMASENDFQIWIERVADNDPMAVVIEDGKCYSGRGGIGVNVGRESTTP